MRLLLLLVEVLASLPTEVLVKLVQAGFTCLERSEVLLVVLCPTSLCHSCNTWEELEESKVTTDNVLCPKVCLYTLNVLFHLRSSIVWHWIVTVSLLNREHITDENHAIIWFLIEIKVIISGWSHDSIQATLSSLNTTVHTTPAHDSCTFVYITLKNLVPTDDVTTLRLQVFCHLIHEVSL